MASNPVTATNLPLSLKQCLFLILALAAITHWFALPKITEISKQSRRALVHDNQLLPIDIAIRNKEFGKHTYLFTIEYSGYQQTSFHVHPYKCISRIILNGFPIAYPFDQRCDFINGMALDLRDRLYEGTNTLKIETEGPGLTLGPTLFNGSSWTLASILGCLLIAASCIALVLFMERLTGERITGYLMAGGLLLYIYVLSHTTFMWKKYDMPQHLEYITFIANNLHWPRTYVGFLTYHPPLYYSLQAMVMLFANWLGSFEVVSMLRLFNVICFMGFVIFAVLTLRKLLASRLAYYFAVLLLMFYPGSAIVAGRMDSNLLFYTWFGGFLYFLARWVKDYRHRDLASAIAMCGLAMATRTNALLLLPILGLAGLYQWKKYSLKSVLSCLKNRLVWRGIAVLLLGIAVNFGRPAYDNLYHNRDQTYLVANAQYLAQIARGLRIANHWDSYLSFSLKDYFYPPFFNVWGSRGGRYYFWVSVMKSSMYGEFEFPNGWLAFYLNGVLLGFVAYILATLCLHYRRLKQQPEWLVFAAALFVPIMGLAANRILHPIACSQDFRYVYPSIVAFCGMVGFAIEQHLTRKRWLWACIGMAAVVAFALLSLVFFAKMF